MASLWVETGEFPDATTLAAESGSVDGDDDQLKLRFEPSVDAEVDVDRLEAPSWMMAALMGFTDVEMEESRHEN